MGYVIGVDVGSQSVKALMMDPDGARGRDRERAVPDEPSGRRLGRAGPGRLGAGAGRCRAGGASTRGRRRDEIDDARARLPGRRARRARRRPATPLRPAIIWLDRRATRQSATLSARGRRERARRRAPGCNPDASHTAPKAMWLRDEEPDIYARTRWLAPVGGAPERLADRRGRPGSRERVVDAALRPRTRALVRRARRATPGSTREQLPPIRPASRR